MPIRRPSGFWRSIIREALFALESEALLSDIYDWIENHVELSERELRPSPHGSRPYFVNTVRGIASDMTDQGKLIRVEDGRYRLPEISP